MKKIFFLVAALVFLSCSSDDNNNSKIDNGGNIPEDEKLLESFDFGSAQFRFEYNGNKTVKRLNLANLYFLDFKYSGEKITSINAIGNGTLGVFEFSYDPNGHLSGFTVNGEERIVQYDPVANSYLYYEQDEEDRTTVFLNDTGDMERYKFYNSYEDDETNILFVYDEDPDKKGPMVNTNNIHLYLAITFPEISFYMAFLARKPVEIVSFSEGTFQCTNSYYDDGFVEQTNIVVSGSYQEDSPSAAIYKYTKL